MIFAVFFVDNSDKAHLRDEHMSDHLSFLEENAATVQAAGPLHDTQDGEPAGGLWLVLAETPAAVRALVEADPFWPTGLRKSVRILEWTQVFAAGERRL